MELDDYLSQLKSDIGDAWKQMNGFSSDVEHNETSEGRALFCPECGTRLPANARFCMECGCNIAEYMKGGKKSEECDQEYNGILWTDTKKLAEKYDEERSQVIQIMNEFIEDNEEMGINWIMLDMADRQRELGEATWMDYSEVLQNFMADNSIHPSPELGLFIIGGNDVIPQPCEDNPSGDGTPYDAHVYADFYYCFYGQLTLDFLDYTKARCNVARLPLETGKITGRTIDEDISEYFSSSNETTDEGGIEIGRAVMTTHRDWIPASREMSRNLPTERLKDEDGLLLDRMYLSPDIMADLDDERSDLYYNSLSNANMLVFNLHGSCEPEKVGFYSNGLAFEPVMLTGGNAVLFNTVACWGARYIYYKREESMLLTAMYEYGILLYSGACVPALGKCGNFNYDDTWSIQPAAYSEKFMARFSEYECLGTMSAGEAFLKAKCDYYNSSRKVEEDELILATVLMFNLYGNPLLRTKPDLERLLDIQPEDGTKAVRIPFRKTKREVVMDMRKDNNRKSSIIGDIRMAVDLNLQAIHDSITENLYNVLGVEPRELKTVEKFSTKDIHGIPQAGYLYNYERHEGTITSRIRAKVDETGRLIDAIQTKNC